LKKVERYLGDYLAPFMEEGKTKDIHYFSNDIEISKAQLNSFLEDGYEEIDLHKTKFEQFYKELPTTNISEFINKVSNNDNSIIIDIASMDCGAKFGLVIAKRNPTINVRLYNPIQDESKKENSLSNATYFNYEITKENLERILMTEKKKNIVIYSDRVCDVANIIANVVGNHENCDVILGPLPQYGTNRYQEDNNIQNINKVIRDFYESPERRNLVAITGNPTDHPTTRLFGAIHLYYALKLAKEISKSRPENSVKIYKKELKKERIFEEPMFYVSTL
jgi:thymidylate synthase